MKGMTCPHCLHGFHPNQGGSSGLGVEQWSIEWQFCPGCGKPTVWIQWLEPGTNVLPKRIIFPRSPARATLPEAVPEDIREDFREAAEVLPVSPKASAALSRRLLQHLLRDHGKVKASNLADEIEEAMPSLPAYLGDAVDAVRSVGNFASHPIKSTSTGEVVPVEDGEAEWTLETVQALIDFYVTKPAALAARRARLNEKLTDAGKPELKGSGEVELEQS